MTDAGPNRELKPNPNSGETGVPEQDNASRADNAEARELSDKMRETRDVPMETIPAEKLPNEVQAVTQDAPDPALARRRTAEDALNKPIEAIEDAVNRLDVETKPERTPSARSYRLRLPIEGHGNETTVFGRSVPYPVYTVIFGILAAITVVEIIIAEIVPKGSFVAPLLLVPLSLLKAVLVVLFYMHLREDSRFFAIALILPVIIALIATLFLLAVPTTGYTY